MSSSIKKYFQVLGVSQHARLEEVKQAYRDLVNVWHPDRFPDNDRLKNKATEKLKEINVAYEEILSFYEQKNAPEDVHSNVSMSAEETVVEPPPFPAGSKSPASGENRSRMWKIALFLVLLIIIIIVVFYTAFRKEKAPQLVPTAILIPDQPKVSVPDDTAQLSEKSSIRKKSHAETTRIFKKGRQAKPKEFFTVGSTKDEVLTVQGAPTQISGNRWSYGFSYVDFEKERVIRWYSSRLDPLHIKMTPSGEPGEAKEFFTVGSTKDEVLAVQGTPTRISGNRWSYGFSYVDFEKERVIRWYSSEHDPLKIEEEP